MCKKVFSCMTAFCLAFLLFMSFSPVSKASQEPLALTVYGSEMELGESGGISVHIENRGTELINLSEYTIEVKEISNTGIAFQYMAPTETLEGGSEAYMPINFTAPDTASAGVISLEISIYPNGAPEQAVTEVGHAYLYEIQGSVLKFLDPSKGEKYELKFELDENTQFEGAVSGADGDMTIVLDPITHRPSRYFLRPGVVGSFVVSSAEGYVFDSLSFIPASAGTVTISNGICIVDLSEPATLQVRSMSRENAKLADNGVFLEGAMPEKDGVRLVSSTLEEGAPETEFVASELGIAESMVSAYEIHLENAVGGLADAEGNPYGLEETVTVNIPVPEGFHSSETRVYHVDTANGMLTDMNGRPSSDGRYISFDTDHFSVYALVSTAEPEKPPVETEPSETAEESQPTESIPEESSSAGETTEEAESESSVSESESSDTPQESASEVESASESEETVAESVSEPESTKSEEPSATAVSERESSAEETSSEEDEAAADTGDGQNSFFWIGLAGIMVVIIGIVLAFGSKHKSAR